MPNSMKHPKQAISELIDGRGGSKEVQPRWRGLLRGFKWAALAAGRGGSPPQRHQPWKGGGLVDSDKRGSMEVAFS